MDTMIEAALAHAAAVAATPSPQEWYMCASVGHWSTGLLQMTGLEHAAVAKRIETLFQFCVQQGINPEQMAEECRKGGKGEDRVARRTHYLRIAAQTPANLIVQSFLVHNGVNVFGDLICMPSTRETLAAEQGQQWVSGSESSEGMER